MFEILLLFLTLHHLSAEFFFFYRSENCVPSGMNIILLLHSVNGELYTYTCISLNGQKFHGELYHSKWTKFNSELCA